MLSAVFLTSFIPLVIIKAGGLESPFFFNSAWRLGSAFGSLLLLLVFFPSLLRNRDVLSRAAQNSLGWIALASLPTSLDYALFSAATTFLDPSISAVIFEVWPIIVIFLASRLLRDKVQQQGQLRSVIPLLPLALVGLGFVIASQSGGFNIEGMPFTRLMAGVALAFLAALAASCATFTFRWGNDLACELKDLLPGSRSTLSLSIFGAVLAHTVVSVVGVFLSSGIGLAVGEQVDSNLVWVLGYGLLGGALLHSTVSVLFRASNLATNNFGVNALSYLTPILTLIWLAGFSEIGVLRPDYLVIGAAATVAVNLLINFRAERLVAFKALVISLWACGTLVYLRDTEKWVWKAEDAGYFEVLFLSATVFALILSFRMVRLASRTQDEDNRAFRMFRSVEELALKGVLSREVCDWVLTIDEKQGQELEDAYRSARHAVVKALEVAEGSDRESLRDLEKELDTLTHSRQQGINFGEICALFIFASLVVGTALLTRPSNLSNLTGFVVEMFTMLFPAVIVFLAFNVLDLQSERISRILALDLQSGDYVVAFQNADWQSQAVEHNSRRAFEQWISVVVGLTIIIAYSVLFLHKWDLWSFTW